MRAGYTIAAIGAGVLVLGATTIRPDYGPEIEWGDLSAAAQESARVGAAGATSGWFYGADTLVTMVSGGIDANGSGFSSGMGRSWDAQHRWSLDNEQNDWITYSMAFPFGGPGALDDFTATIWWGGHWTTDTMSVEVRFYTQDWENNNYASSKIDTLHFVDTSHDGTRLHPYQYTVLDSIGSTHDWVGIRIYNLTGDTSTSAFWFHDMIEFKVY